eukprot:1934831-Prymnesium_polylepis.1
MHARGRVTSIFSSVSRAREASATPGTISRTFRELTAAARLRVRPNAGCGERTGSAPRPHVALRAGEKLSVWARLALDDGARRAGGIYRLLRANPQAPSCAAAKRSASDTVAPFFSFLFLSK